MRYLRIGYITVFFTPLLAIIVWLLVYWSLRFYNYDWLFPIMVQIGENMSIIGVQMFGLILCLLGIKKGERIPFKASDIFLILASDVLLILWGALAIWWGIGGYGELRNLTIWDYMAYATFVIEGLLWISSSIIFIATAYERSAELKLQKLD
jgi:hypothetical protein